ncbi:hypothetical protein MMC30_007661 [Trapelia coarctata]|nr:hypothetical protein [Trapelia coarctata]
MVSWTQVTCVLAMLGEVGAVDAGKGKKHWHGWGKVEKLFPFGDSYTTTSFNLSSTQPGPGNPLGNPLYPGATSSNGPNWVDYLMTTYNKSFVETYNIGFGGAVVSSDLVQPFLPTVDFRQQVNDEFIPYYVQKNTTSWTSDNSLFAFFFGINDINISYGGRNATLNGDIFVVYRGLVDQLYSVGARNFLFLNVPAVNHAPTTTVNGRAAVSLEGLDIADFNDRLTAMANGFANTYRDATVFLFNTNAIFSAVLKYPAIFNQTAGYKNTTSYCVAYQDGTPAEDTFYPNCSIPVNQYFWLNSLHPTYPMHDVMAKQIAKALEGGDSLQI